MRHKLVVALIGSLCLIACNPVAPRTLTVFAASSLSDAFAEIGRGFEQAEPGTRVVMNFAGTQVLAAQLAQGAPADLFAPASIEDMDLAVTAGNVDRAAVRAFATNSLVVVVAPGNPGRLQQIEDLARPGLKLVLAAAEVPAGRYSREALTRLEAVADSGYAGRVLANVVSSEENVRQVLAKVRLGEADAGIVYASDAAAAPGLGMIPIPPAANVEARYAIAVLRASRQPDLAARFSDYVASGAGQVVLARWGLRPLTK